MAQLNSNQIESSPNQQRILITGVSGLIGRFVFDYLTTKYPTKYQVFGLDQHMKISSRYQHENIEVKTQPSIPLNKFFQCDITDRAKLHQIIEEHKIDIIIHLAAALESDPDIEKISRVNIDGTRNIFEAPGVSRIIYASSVMTVFGYLTREPYLSIRNDTFDDAIMLKQLRKLTEKDDLPLPDVQTPGNKAYCLSKIIAEQMADDVVKNSSKSIICARFGSINIEDEPGTAWLRCLWFSHRDVCLFIDKALHAPLHVSGTYFAISNNHRLWVDLEAAKKDLDFVPQDGAEKLS